MLTNFKHGSQWMDPDARESKYCGCVGGSFNGAQLIKIYDFKQKKVSACLNDQSFPRWEDVAQIHWPRSSKRCGLSAHTLIVTHSSLRSIRDLLPL